MRYKMTFCLCMACGAAAVGVAVRQSLAQSPKGDKASHSEGHANATEAKPREDALREAMDSVTVLEMSSVHGAILERMIEQLPAGLELSVRNQGIVTETGPLRIRREGGGVLSHSFRIVGDIGKPLHWQVVDGDMFVVFTMWLSISTTDESVANLPGKNRRLYVNVSGSTPAMLAEPRNKLGGRSIADLMRLLNKDVPAK